MRRSIASVGFGFLLACASPADAQQDKWEILDNSFLVEEAFNQERDVFQNIFTWTGISTHTWAAAFTQEWPVRGIRHQLSYTIPFSRIGGSGGLNDVLVNYRYQLLEEAGRRPAVSPRVSVVLPTGRQVEGSANGRTGVEINVPASKQFGDLYVHANAGVRWVSDLDALGFVAGSLIWRTTPMLNLMIEALQLPDSSTISPGLRRGWAFGDRQLVLGAAAPLTLRAGSTEAALLTYASFELRFR